MGLKAVSGCGLNTGMPQWKRDCQSVRLLKGVSFASVRNTWQTGVTALVATPKSKIKKKNNLYIYIYSNNPNNTKKRVEGWKSNTCSTVST